MAAIETPDARHVRFRLKEPWPDFLTFYATATGAAWIVPKAYLEKVGDDGYKKAPIGAGPYRFVSFKPGVEIVMVYLPFVKWLIVGGLVVLSVVKFMFVIFYFMHLKWDKPFCTILFFIGLILAGGTMWALLKLLASEASVPLTISLNTLADLSRHV